MGIQLFCLLHSIIVLVHSQSTRFPTLNPTYAPTIDPTNFLRPTSSPTSSFPTAEGSRLQAVNIVPFTGYDVHFKVPNHIKQIYVYLWGAGGGGTGGAGAYVEGMLPVPPGSLLTVIVGGGGGGSGPHNGFGGYGGGGTSSNGVGGGGGRSAIQINGLDIVTAGGGGGGWGYQGGAATSFSNGQLQVVGFPGEGSNGGGGGQYSDEQCLGGGSLYHGGSGFTSGGGSGYCGGGVGSANSGGGGCSNITNLLDYTLSDSGTTSSGTCNGQYSAYYDPENCGGNIPYGNGQNGKIVIVVAGMPSQDPTEYPSLYPSHPPSFRPSVLPTDIPSIRPSIAPTDVPSIRPSIAPTDVPSIRPSMSPTDVPSIRPSMSPTDVPSIRPSLAPTERPTSSLDGFTYIVQKRCDGAGESVVTLDTCFSSGEGMSMYYVYVGSDASSGTISWALVQFKDEHCQTSFSKIIFSNPSKCEGGSTLSYAMYIGTRYKYD